MKFAAVHKVFGASNVSKLLMEVPLKVKELMQQMSLVYEANLRLRVLSMVLWAQFQPYNNKFNYYRLSLVQPGLIYSATNIEKLLLVTSFLPLMPL
ncbi:hypothetical protein OIU85_003002 [Salix viminalis]|uniref:LOB domain-containing protein n=1 Tax=Salix viminalis TaxID=40686 RepID=A0A9Q0PYT1_SALVM|nr:hypothetical protein OIU85_003002 [Salix viminalis]